MSKLYEITQFKSDEVLTSDYGYYILPNGDVVSLNELQTHGKVAFAIEPKLADMIGTNYSKIETAYDVAAVSQLNWIRISISPYIYTLNVDWGQSYTSQQLLSLKNILDIHDPDGDNEIWYTGGPGNKNQLFRKLKEHTVYTFVGR